MKSEEFEIILGGACEMYTEFYTGDFKGDRWLAEPSSR
jgi:hypothetical protein